MDRDRSSRRAREHDGNHRSRDRDDDRHRRRSGHDTDDHHKHGGGNDDRRRHRDKDGRGDDEDRRGHRHHRDKEYHRSHRHRDGGDDDDDRRRGSRQSVSSSESPPPSAKGDRSSSLPRESIDRRELPSSSRKRKGHEGVSGGDEADRDVGKRARASVDPPPSKEERPRRERRRFEDVDANGKNGDVRSKEISSHEQKKGELVVNGDLQSGSMHNVSTHPLLLLSSVYYVFM